MRYVKDQDIDDALKAGTWKQRPPAADRYQRGNGCGKSSSCPAVANLMRNSVYIEGSPGSCNECEDSTCKEMPKQEGS